ncbi:single-stranded DNA-binding protein [Delftia sp. HK171]|uniref:single-stranded DNA-binding protein n=1 Tax=Delftia sp. HK171 TaxID=1920191 RepID=UPI001153442B|nr:single-stranded DNA-binding protein [Delftia sp. HK171]TQL81140.1 single-strand DNA-binding protein [Delftia sp. HK171]
MQNIFIGKGNLGQSPDLRVISGANGDFEVASMRIMFGRYARNKTSGEVEQVGGFWREVEIYGQKARDVARLLRRGSRVLVYGEERDFMAKDSATGAEVQVIKIVAEDIALQLSRVKSIEFETSSRRAPASGDTEPEAEPASA